MSPSNILDLIVLLPILYGLIHGLFKGLILELTSIVVVIVGFIVTKIYAPAVAVWLASVVTWNEQVCRIAAYIILFFGIAIILTLLSKLLTKFIHAISLGFVNRLLGGLVGAAKWALIASVLLNLILMLNCQFAFLQPDALSDSYAVNYIAKLASIAWEGVKDVALP